MSEVLLSPEWLLNFGVLGVVLAWFMFRLEKFVNKSVEVQTALVAKIEFLCSQIKRETAKEPPP